MTPVLLIGPAASDATQLVSEARLGRTATPDCASLVSALQGLAEQGFAADDILLYGDSAGGGLAAGAAYAGGGA